MADSIQIDPQTGERIPQTKSGTVVTSVPSSAIQIDPQTGERISTPGVSGAAPHPIGGNLRSLTLPEQLTQIRPDDPNQNLLQRGANFIGNIGAGGIGTILHPIETAKGIASTVIHPEDAAKNLYQGLNTHPGETIAPMVGQAAVMGGAGELAKPIAAPIGAAMQRGGVKMINHTVGALKNDFKRGANPGEGYFQAGMGPSLTMKSIANKASDAHEAAGESIGRAIDSGTGAGVKIPTAKIAQAVNGPADEARSVLNGPFGGGSEALDARMATFLPKLYPRVSAGIADTMSPKDVFSLKRGVAKNVNWSDPTNVGIKQVGQQITGGLSGALSDAVPELKPLNSAYQNLGKLSERANYRADTGISPLTEMGRRGIEAAAGAGLGMATHHPLLGALPLAIDSVPVRTGVASGLYYGGRALTRAPLAPIGTSAGVAGRLYNKKPDEESDEK